MMAVDQFARMMAMDAAQQGGGSYTKAETDALLDDKADLVNGKVPAAQLPSYVDDVAEGYMYQGRFYSDAQHTQEITGEEGKIYLDLATNTAYRWSGNSFIAITGQADWNQTDTNAPDYIKNKPTIPTVDQTYDPTSTNPQSGTAVAESIAKKPGEITAGKQYTIDGQTVTAGTGAEAFNDLTGNKAAGAYSHAEGQSTTASGAVSHAEGAMTIASGVISHAEGQNTTASGNGSHAEGQGTKASSQHQHVQGKFNEEDANSTYAFIIGNGTADNARHNAFAVDWNGLIYVNGAATGVDVSQLTAVAQAVSSKISATDYATQTTGGTIKAWTTTDGSDTILHLATQ